MEIERKWLINGFPDIEKSDKEFTESGYVSLNPEVRVSKHMNKFTGDEYYLLTIKGKGNLARDEVNIQIRDYDYLALTELIPHELIKKESRYYDLEDGFTLEVHFVDDNFYYAEVEFDTVHEAENFIPPDYLDREVTSDPYWKMANYWKRSRLTSWD